MLESIRASKKAIIQTVATFAFFALMQVSTWLPLRFWSAWGGGNFLDMWQVLNYADCFKSVGLKIYDTNPDPCSNYLYGRWLVKLLNIFHVGPAQTQVMGFLFLLLLAITITGVFKVESKSDFFVFALAITSPPVLLLADRGNFDILIIFLIFISQRLFQRNRHKLALTIIFISSIFKFYTTPLLLLSIFFGKSTKAKILATFYFLTATYLNIQDILITKADYPHGSISQFGMNIWGEYLNGYNSTQGSSIRNICIGIVVFVSLMFIGKPILIFFFPDLKFDLGQNVLFDRIEATGSLFLLAFLSCYFLGTSFDYRLVIILLVLLKKIKSSSYVIQNEYTIFMVVILWLSFPSGGLQPLGDLVLEIGIGVILRNMVLRMFYKFRNLEFRNKLPN